MKTERQGHEIIRAIWSLFAAITLAGAVAQAQTYQVLYSFTGGSDGETPVAALVRDSAGDLYGTSFYGGTSDMGTVFKVDASGKESVLYSFAGVKDGANPFAGLVRDDTGNLYGTTEYGGTFNNGTVFVLSTSGTETVLYSFTGGADGSQPLAGLVRDSAGNLYGTTVQGGNMAGSCAANAGCGTVFRVNPTGKETVLHSFTYAPDGAAPYAGSLIRDASGNLYGTTYDGGAARSRSGTVFKVGRSGAEKVLYCFVGGAEGYYPTAGLVRDSAGNLYGSTSGGGDLGCNNGSGCGTVFKLDTTGTETVLYSFIGGTQGYNVSLAFGLVRDRAGNLYGTTEEGGNLSCNGGYGCGTVFKLDPAGNETILHSFSGGTDGAAPQAGLIMDSSGTLYGTTAQGGSIGCGADGLGCGTVFKLKP
jgi:uncharacterized repeat protein (TIGR03803 family)